MFLQEREKFFLESNPQMKEAAMTYEHGVLNEKTFHGSMFLASHVNGIVERRGLPTFGFLRT
jgi:hypothetical protein